MVSIRESIMLILFIFIFIIFIFGIGAILKNRSPTGVVGDDKPQIAFNDANIVLKPDNQGTTSTYKIMEYSLGETLSDNVDIIVNWSNGAGFKKNKVVKLVFRRFINDTEISTPEEASNSTQIADYGGGEVTFRGLDLKTGEDGVGQNIIKVYYVIENGTSEIELAETQPITITQQHLNTTIDITQITTLVFPVTSGDTLEGVVKISSEYNKYNIQHISNSWRVEGLRMKALTSGEIQFLDDSGKPKSLWSSGPTQVFFSEYLGNLLMHKGDRTSGEYWIIDTSNTPASIRSSGTMNIFKTQANLNSALFKITTYTPPPPPPPPAAPACWTYSYSSCPIDRCKRYAYDDEGETTYECGNK